MNYGKLRQFYLNDFALLKKEATIFFDNYLKNSIYELYEHFVIIFMILDWMGNWTIDSYSCILYMSFCLNCGCEPYGNFLLIIAYHNWSIFHARCQIPP